MVFLMIASIMITVVIGYLIFADTETEELDITE